MADVIARSEAEMLGLGAALARVLRAGDVIALSGGLGAGKTTLARGLLAALGLAEEAPSPPDSAMTSPARNTAASAAPCSSISASDRAIVSAMPLTSPAGASRRVAVPS